MPRPTLASLLWPGALGLGAGLAIALWSLVDHPWVVPVRRAPVPPVSRDFRWGIAWHPDNLLREGRSPDTQLAAIQDLGVGLTRFDVRWSDMQPQEGAPLATASLDNYRRVLDTCVARGMQVKVNLGGYPAWSIRLLSERPAEFFRQYRAYVGAVADALGPGVSYYQLGNEFNTILDPIPRQWDGRVFNEAGAALAVRRKRWPGWPMKTVINVCDTFHFPWKDHLEQALSEASGAVDVIGYDFYPGNYSNLADWGAWPEIPYLTELMQRYGKDGAICETGCPAILGEDRQARWIAQATRAMLGAIARSPLRDRFRFAVFYELSDAREPFFWPPPSEGSFGLLRLDGSRKPAYEAFREVVGLTRDRQAGIRHKSLQSTAWPIE